MIVIFNKIVLTVFAFTSVPFIMFCQSIFTIGVFLIRRDTIQRPGKDIFWVCLLNSANIFFGISSAGALNVAMFTALRRVSIFMTMVAQYIFLKTEIRKPVFWSVVVMIGGSVVAAANDLTFDLRGYTYVTINNLLTAGAQIQTKKTLSRKWTKTTVLFWSSVMTFILSGVQLIHFNPKSFDAWDQPAFLVAFVFSMVLGFFINYGATWTVEKNDALTLAVAGSTKSAIMGLVVCAGLFDPTYKFSWWNFIGLQISALASFVYVYYAKQKSAPKTQMPPV
jgi:solute carrier family 35 protein